MSDRPSPPGAPSAGRRILAAFSPRANLRDVWHRAGDAYAPLDGLRAIAVLWVMLFHCFTIPTMQWPSALNMIRFLDEPALGVAFSGHLGVEIFLVMSGFLMAHLLIRERERTGRIGFFAFLRRRWLRIVPLYAAVIGAYMAMDAHQRVVCARWGLVDLFFLNNFIGDQLNFDACLIHSWSIAVEFQLYLVSPFVVRWMFVPRRPGGRPFGLVPPLLLMALSTAVSCAIVLRHRGEPLGTWYLTSLYNKTYARATPYFAGVAVAWLFHRHDPARPRAPWRRPVQALALGAIAAIAYLGAGEHPSRYLPGAIDLHPWRNLFLLLFARELFSLGVAVVMFEALTGAMALAARFLSWSVWVPFARLSYAAYLLQFLCMIPLFAVWSRDYATARSFADLAATLAADGAASVVVCFAVALVFHLAVEKPIVNLR